MERKNVRGMGSMQLKWTMIKDLDDSMEEERNDKRLLTLDSISKSTLS